MTASQRARLVVALGVVNLVLATIALAVGTVGVPTLPPAVPRGSDAANLPSTSPSPVTEPSPSAAPTRRPGPPPVAPSPTIGPSTSPAIESPAIESPLPTEPSATAQPTSPPPVAAVPTPASTATRRPRPATTTRPTPVPTPRAPTPTPTAPTVAPPAPTPSVVNDRVKAHPPCPDRFAPPPGHAKVEGPKERPCGPGKGRAGRLDGGFVVVAPLALAGWAARRAHLSSRGIRRTRR